ncbi:MAG: hypothetical protein ACLPN1_05325 [Dissulfurispiraceae bacterium]
MPPYLLDVAVLKSIWPIPILALTLALIIAICAGTSIQRKELFLVSASLSMLGAVTGYLGGFSRVPAFGTILPAVLSLMGGLIVYLVGRHASSRVIVSVSIFAFSLTLLIGTEWGAVMRDLDEESRKSEMYLKNRAFIEAQVNEFRQKLNLSPLSTETEPKVK